MLHGQYANRAFGTHNRNARKAVKAFLTCFGNIAEIRVGGCLIQVQCFDIFRNRADKAFAEAEPGDVDRRFVQSARRK